MNVRPKISGCVKQDLQPRQGFTMIEMIGVLAIVAVIAALLVPISLRHLDQVASEQEMARLQALGGALQQSILRTRSIPSPTNWASVLAAQSGMDIRSVTNNFRNRPRVFLVDAGGWCSTNLPFSQGPGGTSNFPASARVILMSSLGKSLPVATGMPTAADFNALWDAPPNTVPRGGWNGDPYDVKIQRVNLSPLFVRLVLSTYNSATNGQFAIDSSATNQVPFNGGFGAYFIKGTTLKLFTGRPTSALDSSQILNEDSSFVYEGGKWKDELRGTLNSSVGNVSGVVAAFLAATPNIRAQNINSNAQQVRVVQTFTDYMSNYNAWAATSFSDNALRTHLVTVQVDMMDAVRGLYYEGHGYNNYPTNATPCP